MDSRQLFETLVHENAASLEVFLRSLLGDSAAVDEVFQETLVAAWGSLDRFERDRPFGAWLRGVARNVIKSRRAVAARDRLVLDDAIVETIDAHCGAMQRMRNDHLDEELSRLEACIDALPPHYREATELRYHEEVRGAALAERLGTSFENAKKRLQRARALLFECMRGRWSAADGAPVS